MGDHVEPGTTMFHTPSKITDQLLDDIVSGVMNLDVVDMYNLRFDFKNIVRKILEEYGV